MMHGTTFSGNLFFDPLAINPATRPANAGPQQPGSALPSGPLPKRGVQSAAEHKALRAASLSKVSRELERMLRERKR
ncbi:hypothetical protein GCM10007170_45050 [Arthrobacter liuii]|uniref:Uncharacterized protein n=1 Tax=Arthrobacter liuii TaxID=1476996 RepID=A0ABQ2AZ20_9MICC|nr:hypothetical protein GCM10007170_45050 [Arthrobacter liuii]